MPNMAGTRADGGKMMQKLLLKLLDTLANNQHFRKIEICSGKGNGKMPVTKELLSSFQRKKKHYERIAVFSLAHYILKMHLHLLC